MKEKLVDGFYKIKSYWRKPPAGYDVPYKEITSFTVGFGSYGIMSVLIQWTGLAINMPLMLYHFKASTGIIFLLGMVGSLIGLIRAPILSMIIDNSNSKHGKFKPFILWTCAFCCICFCLIPFIPYSWSDISVFSINMPAMPIFGVKEASSVTLSVGLLVMFVLMQIGTCVHQLFTQVMTGIENTISTVAQERSGIVAIKNLISNLPNSLVNIVLPLIASAFALGMKDVRIYQISFPLIAVIAFGFAVVMFRGTKERAVVNKKHKNKVGFWKGAKALSKNKYFWMLAIFSIFSGLRGGANIYMWICTYSVPPSTGAILMSICNMVLNNAFIPGLLLGPWLVKKFGKAKVMTTSNICFAIMVALQLAMIYNPYVTLVGIFFQNLSLSVSFVSSLMTSDVLDYQQYKSNIRLEGFWHNYSAFILTFAGIFTAILSPLFLSFGGVAFGAPIDEVLQDSTIRMNAYRYTTYLAIIGGVLSIVPMLFYDLTEYKHRNIIRGLKVRKAAENLADNALEDNDILYMKEVLDYITEVKSYEGATGLSKKQIKEIKSSHYVFEEIAKYDESLFDNVLKFYDEAYARNVIRVEQERLDGLGRNIEFEEKITALKLAAIKAKAEDYKSTVAKNGGQPTKYDKQLDKLNAKIAKIQSEIDELKQVAESFNEATATEIVSDNEKSVKKLAAMMAKLESKKYRVSSVISFNEEEYANNLIANSRFIKDREQLSGKIDIADLAVGPNLDVDMLTMDITKPNIDTLGSGKEIATADTDDNQDEDSDK